MKAFIYILIALMLIIGCQASSEVERNALTHKKKADIVKQESKYIPPKDGRITEEQADRYINVAKSLNKAIEEQVVIMEKFYKKYNIASKEEINKIENNEQAMKEWETIMKNWEQKEKDVYKQNNMSSEEFDWIASALIDEKNADIQKKIEKALTQ